ncbi:hypothetical protein ACWC9T_23385 [Kitasatospora sp. NPDC001159]
MVPRGNWRMHLPPDDDALDALDEKTWAELRALAGRSKSQTDNG